MAVGGSEQAALSDAVGPFGSAPTGLVQSWTPGPCWGPARAVVDLRHSMAGVEEGLRGVIFVHDRLNEDHAVVRGGQRGL